MCGKGNVSFQLGFKIIEEEKMLDFIKDIVLETQGIDTEKVHKEKIKKEEEKRSKYYLLSNRTKIIIFIFGIIYLSMEMMNIIISWEKNGMIFIRAKGIILSFIDIAVLVLLTQKNKKAEILAIILSVIFITSMYVSSAILRWY